MRATPGPRARRRWQRAGRVPLPVLLVAVMLALGGIGVAVARGGANGQAIQVIALDAHPSGLTLDPASGHAFISTSYFDSRTNSITPDTRLRMLDLRSGAVARTIDVGFVPQSIAVDGRAGRLFLAGGAQIAFVDTHSGRVLAALTLDQPFGAMTPDERHGRLYVALGGSGGVAVLDARSGTVLHEVSVGSAQGFDELVNAGPPAVDEPAGRAFLPFSAMTYGTGLSGRSAITDGVAILDANGRLLRTTEIGHYSASQGSPPTLAVDPMHSRVLVLDANTERVSTVDARTGRLVHALRLQTTSTSGSDGTWGLDARTGRLFIVTPGNWSCVPQSHGSCYRPGDLYVLDTRSGRVVRRLPGSRIGSGSVTVDAPAGCVLVLGGSGRTTTLDILDAGTGELRRRIDLALSNYALYLLVDPQTGRAYVVDSRGTISTLDTRSGQLSTALTVGDISHSPLNYTWGIANAIGIADGRIVVLHDDATMNATPTPDPLGWLPVGLRRWLPWRARAALGSVSIVQAPH